MLGFLYISAENSPTNGHKSMQAGLLRITEQRRAVITLINVPLEIGCQESDSWKMEIAKGLYKKTLTFLYTLEKVRSCRSAAKNLNVVKQYHF